VVWGDRGWVGELGVLKPWRGRGIASALLRRAFATFAARELPRVMLNVDAANPTGAVRLYERLGMRTVRGWGRLREAPRVTRTTVVQRSSASRSATTLSVLDARRRALVEEGADGGCERGPERLGFERADVSVLEPSEGLGGQVVVAARLRGGLPLAEAGERERVVAHRADVVLRLPDASPARCTRAQWSA
jgi:hypothetical protein